MMAWYTLIIFSLHLDQAARVKRLIYRVVGDHMHAPYTQHRIIQRPVMHIEINISREHSKVAKAASYKHPVCWQLRMRLRKWFNDDCGQCLFQQAILPFSFSKL
jgi:hypothetical protein